MRLYWPIVLIVVSNIFYNICSKSTPTGLNPFAALTVTYVIGAAAVSYTHLDVYKRQGIVPCVRADIGERHSFTAF